MGAHVRWRWIVGVSEFLHAISCYQGLDCSLFQNQKMCQETLSIHQDGLLDERQKILGRIHRKVLSFAK
jgi:hypothetical protein